MIHRASTYRLIPGTRTNARFLWQICGANRFVWNRFLAENNALYDAWKKDPANNEKPFLTFFSLGTRFTKLRKETPWLQDLPCVPVKYSLKYLEDAYRKFFREKDAGSPKFKARHKTRPSFTIPADVRIRNGRLRIPRLGYLLMRRRGQDPYVKDGIVKRATVYNDCGKWYVSIVYGLPDEYGVNRQESAVGIDRNIRQITLSDGQRFDTPQLKTLEAKKNRYKRKLARQVKGSNRRRRTLELIRKCSRRKRQCLGNWAHQSSRRIANQYGMAVLEDLSVKNMTRSAKGTAQHPGENVQAKKGLNRSILESAWGKLALCLAYKTEVVRVPPQYTSQTCSKCGYVSLENRRSQASFLCVSCGYGINADINAAINILASGLGAAGRREAFALATSATRQMESGAAPLSA